MIDLSYITLVQLVNFGLLIIILNAILLKPVLKHLSERENKISSSHDEAKANADKAEEMLADFEQGLAEARVKASQSYNKLQGEGVDAQRAKMEEAKQGAQKMIEEARAQVRAESDRAREILDKEMEKLPGQIASKLLGRTV